MKKIFTLAFIFVLTLGFSQSVTRNYNAWRFGLNIGGMWQTADVRSTAGVAGGFTLEKALLENRTHFFSLAIRGRGLFGNTYGLDYSRNYDVKNNDALNGNYNKEVDYNDSTVSRPYIYNNYKTEIAEGALELQVSFNSLRERTNVLLNLWGGIGFTSYRANTNLLDVSGKMYNYAKVDSLGSQSAVLSSHKNLLDNTYESYAQGSKNSNIYTLSPSAGIGLGYRFSNHFSIIYEYKVTFPLGLNADYLDGITGKNNDKIAGSKDYYHYTGINLLFSFGKGKTKTRDTTKYVTHNNYQPVHTNTITNVTTSVTPTATNVPIAQKPIVNFVNPSVSPYNETRSVNFNVAAAVYHVASSSQIQVTVNGNGIPNFSFTNGNVTFPISLAIGNNVIVIKATNSAGSDSETAIINYSGTPPKITYVTPPVNPFSTNVASVDVNATIYNVVSNYDVTVKFNNNPFYNYSYSVAGGKFNTQLPLVPGLNQLEINATNPFGSDNKKLVINYTQPINTTTTVATANRPVKVTITNPGSASYKTNSNVHNVFSTVTGVNSAGQVTVTVNGAVIPFNYSGGAVDFIANLNEGNNIVVVSGKNSSSSDSKSAIIVYEAIKKNPPPSVVITNPQPSPHTTNAGDFTFKATTYFVNSVNQIEIKFNGTLVSNYSFNAVSGAVEFYSNLNSNANNIFEIKVTNNAGSNSASAVVKQETLGGTEAGFDPQIIICHNDGNGGRQTITINQSQWASHQAHGDVMGSCPKTVKPGNEAGIDPDMVICHLNDNGGKQTMNIKQSQWAAHQAHGDAIGECPKVIANEEPVPDPSITICHKNGDGTSQTLTIKQSQWAAHQAHGDQQGPCPKIGRPGNIGEVDPDIIICHNDGNGGFQTLTIKQSQWTMHQAHGDQMGACPRIVNIEEEKKITICHIPPGNTGNPQTIQIPISAWPAHQAHGDTQGACVPSNNNGGGNNNSGGNANQEPEKKITICHIPPGNTGNPQTIEISESAWPAHQAHGDTKGACVPSNNNGGGNNNSGGNASQEPEKKITICHIPPGNTGNPQTIEISESAWPAHQAHGDTKGACVPSNNNSGGNGNSSGNSGNNSSGGGASKKITICHKPPGNNANPQTIEIDESAWPAHEAHGDTKGACSQKTMQLNQENAPGGDSNPGKPIQPAKPEGGTINVGRPR